jgi:hypothetical protein
MNPGKFWTNKNWLGLSHIARRNWLILCHYITANPSTTHEELLATDLFTPLDLQELYFNGMAKLESGFVSVTALRKPTTPTPGRLDVRERRELLSAWETGFQNAKGCMPTITIVDRSVLKKLHEKHGFELVKYAIDKFVNDAWWMDHSPTVGSLSKHFDKFRPTNTTEMKPVTRLL